MTPDEKVSFILILVFGAAAIIGALTWASRRLWANSDPNGRWSSPAVTAAVVALLIFVGGVTRGSLLVAVVLAIAVAMGAAAGGARWYALRRLEDEESRP
ncbi:MAG: hypothetical protein M3O70_14900 [Actinomycetota bacterium]|nr:hypothetical protein [Actinomycetota bacterium]